MTGVISYRATPANDLPREADKIMSGNCGVVAICVTHPPWPWRVPRNVICSVIVDIGWQLIKQILSSKILLNNLNSNSHFAA